MSTSNTIPVVSVEVLEPADALSAVESAAGDKFSRTSVYVEPQGLDFSIFLDWAIQDAKEASAPADEKARGRLLVSALMNARRALSALVDQYLRRDGLSYCKDAPHDADAKAGLLVRRGIFDQLAADALGRAVERRNRVEHQYEVPNAADTQDTVQLVRATIDGAIARSDPKWSPGFYGSFAGGFRSGRGGHTFWFDGWHELVLVLAVSEPEPWFGILIPSSKSEAVLRRASLREFTCDQLIDLHTALDLLPHGGFSGYGAQMFRGQLQSAGLA